MKEKNVTNTDFITERSQIFCDNTQAIEFLKKLDLIQNFIVCNKCNRFMELINNDYYNNSLIYYCKFYKCKNKKRIFEGKLLQKPKILLKNYLFSIFKWLNKNSEKNILQNSKISKLTFQKIKKNLSEFINYKNSIISKEKLGGINIKVEVDETVITHEELTDCPSNLNDNRRGVIWLVGLIEEGVERRVKLIIVKNRTKENFIKLFKNNVKDYTTIISDGHPSYPAAVESIHGTHLIVNHSLGFKNEEGFTTNNIEGLWGLLKYEIKKRKGVLKSNIDCFLAEFIFRYQNIANYELPELTIIFIEIITFFSNN